MVGMVRRTVSWRIINVLLERLKWISMIWDFSRLVRIPNVGMISWKLSTWHIRQDPLDWKSGLASAAKSAAGDFMGQFWDDEKWLDRGNIQDRNDCDECCQTLKLITHTKDQSWTIISNPFSILERLVRVTEVYTPYQAGQSTFQILGWGWSSRSPGWNLLSGAPPSVGWSNTEVMI